MSLFDHPGLTSYADGSIEVLHADWPVYPFGHGWQLALRSLAAFPQEIRFLEVDDIDQCLLVVAVGSGPCLEPKDDLYDSKLFHVAVWREDLVELYKRGLLSGCTLLTEYQAAMAYYHKVKDRVLDETETKDAQLHTLPTPVRNDLEEQRPTLFQIASEGLRLTREAEQALKDLARPLDTLDSAIRERVTPLLSIRQFDTAVREAAIILESRLRDATNTSKWGQGLIEEYYATLCSRNGGQETAHMKIIRSELRTLFKFVRNEFAHALRRITSDQCNVLLDRVSDVVTTVVEIETAARAKEE